MKTARSELERLVWKHTHADFRGAHPVKRADGRLVGLNKSVLHLVPGKGTCIVYLKDLSDAELAEKLPRAEREKWELKWRRQP